MKKETKKRPQTETWTDIHDDELMVSLGLRQPPLAPRNESVWTKTEQEKKQAKKLHRGTARHFHSVPKKHIPVLSRMVVYLKSNKRFPQSTYSMKCWQSDIDDIISFFKSTDKKGYEHNVVLKYSFNGKTYSPEERPFWF